MENTERRIRLDSNRILICHKCLRKIPSWSPKVIHGYGNGNDLTDIYHPECWEILNPEVKE